ncbi:SUMF1/EgtB/PvdO family nonheme iron enzyme [Aureivirga sp. CE67]|uniref:SUMF1/EgtB/PvdO family nonheme iron enzyme n=1 Tax=Aureivirga sp. CE67 TaxID=1788983 RepID=UPI0018CB1658|nr:SUMF1/EgtB/PvdO family nonheme iron enzyme [Aureivirga sp. CE67]
MKKSLLFFLLFPVSFFAQKNINWKNPENFISINDSISVSKFEVNKVEFNEFLKAHKNEDYDSEVKKQMNEMFSYSFPLGNDQYFYHPSFTQIPHPVIGVSFEQANKFCSWITKKYTEEHPDENVYFRLISVQEWEEISKGDKFKIVDFKKSENIFVVHPEIYLDSSKKFIWEKSENDLDEKNKYEITNFNTKDKILYISEKEIFFKNKKPYDEFGVQILEPSIVYDLVANEKGFYHLFDNISEMTSTKGIAMGDNYYHNKGTFKNQVKYTKPEVWLGFRIVKCKNL